MDDIAIPGRDDERRVFQYFLGQNDGPAFLRRARRVQEAHDRLVEKCRRQREEWLGLVRFRLGRLVALAGQPAALLPLYSDPHQLEALDQLQRVLQPEPLHLPVSDSLRVLRGALGELQESIKRFNQRWQSFVQTVDLGEVNRLREGYNRFYLLEKECALRSARLARQHFVPLEPLTWQYLAHLFPCLPMPK